MKVTDRIKRQLTGEYLKPNFPDGPFMLVNDKGVDDGIFYGQQLQQSDYPGRPWGFSGLGGSDKVFRVKSQKGDTITCEEGSYRIIRVVAA